MGIDIEVEAKDGNEELLGWVGLRTEEEEERRRILRALKLQESFV